MLIGNLILSYSPKYCQKQKRVLIRFLTWLTLPVTAGGIPSYDPALLTAGKADEDVIRQALQFFIWQLEGLRSWEKPAIFAIAKEVATFHELKIKDFLEPIFVAITGKTSSTSVLDAMEILGSDLSRARLRVALAHIGVSKKQAKNIERAYRDYPQA